MNNPVSLTEIIGRMQRETGADSEKIKEFIHSFFQIISRDLKLNEKSTVYPLGTFKKIWVRERQQFNPFTKGKITVKAHYKIVFKPMPGTAEKVNSEFSHLQSGKHPSLLKTALFFRDSPDFFNEARPSRPSLLKTARACRIRIILWNYSH